MDQYLHATFAPTRIVTIAEAPDVATLPPHARGRSA
jgi:hypothetical protein